MKRTRVLVCDSSIYMTGIAAGLKADPTLDVVCVHPRSAEVWQHLVELMPAVIAFDLGHAPPDWGMALLQDQPSMLLIGVDQFSSEMLVITCQHEEALAVADLIKVIHERRLEVEPAEETETREPTTPKDMQR